MKVRWLKDKITCVELEKALGLKRGEVKSITNDPETGIETDFETTPTESQLERLDLMFPELKREGGKSLAERIEALESKITELEKETSRA